MNTENGCLFIEKAEDEYRVYLVTGDDIPVWHLGAVYKDRHGAFAHASSVAFRHRMAAEVWRIATEYQGGSDTLPLLPDIAKREAELTAKWGDK